MRRGRVRRVQAQLRQCLPGGHGDLRGHQVDTGDGLGDGVLHLQPRVGLDEDHRQVGAVLVDQELEGAQPAVAAGLRQPQRGGDQLLAQRGVQAGAGRDFHQLLEATLQRALTFTKGHHLPAVTQHLHLQMAGMGDQALGIDRAQAEGGQRLGAAAGEGLGQVGRVLHGAHAAPATTRHRLQHHTAGRVAAALVSEEVLDLFQRGRTGAWQQRHTVLSGQCACAGLVAEQRQLRRRGADEHHAGVGAGLGKVGPLAQEAVAGVHRLAAGVAGRSNQRCDVEIGRRPGGVQRHRLVGQPGVQGAGVVTREHRHGGNAQVLRCTQDAHRHFAAVGDQESFEHGADHPTDGPQPLASPW